MPIKTKNNSTFLIPNFSLVKPFTFSAKEKDSETGLSVTSLRSVSSLRLGNLRTSSHCTRSLRRFGSRYYSSELSIWLSVDPMVSKYPSLSPYTYCANNPIKLVDPNGEDWVEREVEGKKEVFYDRSVKSQADVNKKYWLLCNKRLKNSL